MGFVDHDNTLQPILTFEDKGIMMGFALIFFYISNHILTISLQQVGSGNDTHVAVTVKNDHIVVACPIELVDNILHISVDIHFFVRQRVMEVLRYGMAIIDSVEHILSDIIKKDHADECSFIINHCEDVAFGLFDQ